MSSVLDPSFFRDEEAACAKLHVWLQAVFLLGSSKGSISGNQLARTLGVAVKTAWLMSRRLREAMTGGVRCEAERAAGA